MCEPAKAIKIQYISPQCQYFVIRKKRLCRMTVKPGKNYCGEHEPQPKTHEGQDDTRIPCPNDPKHTCYVSKLEKHLSICNARQQEQPSYIVRNVNAPTTKEDFPRLPLTKVPLRRILQVIDKVNMLYDTHLKDKIATLPEYPIHSAVAQEFNEAGRMESSLRHLRQASALLHVVEGEKLVQNNTAYIELGAGKGQLSYYAWHAWCRRSDSRVLLVDRASLRHKRDNKLRDNTLRTTPTRRNNTSTTTQNTADIDVAQTDESTQNEGATIPDEISKNVVPNNVDIMEPNNVDANGVNTKTNTVNNEQNSIKKNGSTVNGTNDTAKIYDGLNKRDTQSYIDAKTSNEINEGDEMINEGACDSNVQRIRADLAHLVLARVPAVQACGGVVGLAKHLCGVATDLALRCITSAEVLARVRGAALASCCHHRCERAAYPAADALQNLGIDAVDFNTLLGIVSWATCGDGRSRDRRNEDSSASHLENTGSHAVDNPAPSEPVDNPGQKNTIQSHESDNPRETHNENAEELGTKNLGLSQPEREAVGRRAKALLDWGRVQYLRGHGFDARLVYYVPTSVSLENVCIVATK